MSGRVRADQLLFEQGLAESREKAKSLIMAGRALLPGLSRPLKPGMMLPADSRFELKPGKDYVSRGAHKLLTILDAFDLDVSGLVCVDAGASTGGFTDCLLQRGAKRVYAIDVGKNQLHEKLKMDDRVISYEGVNLRYAPADLLPEKADFLTGDVSFISLTHILPACDQWLKSDALIAILIKPQFELEPAKVRKGVVHKQEWRDEAVAKITGFCESGLGYGLIGVLPARIRGPKGNQEYMALFKKNGPAALASPHDSDQ